MRARESLDGPEFDALVANGAALPFSGWDFSAIARRWRAGRPPWDYAGLLRRRMASAASMVDLGTGGGEFLAKLRPFPARTFATESYRPNRAIARRRLGALGVHLLPVLGRCRIALPARSMELVADRHEEFSAAEVFRVLNDGATFVTQQVGKREGEEFRRAFGTRPPPATNDVRSARSLGKEVAEAGLEILRASEARYTHEFLDVGAVVFYLRAIPWEVEGFSPRRHREGLRAIHEEIQRRGAFRVTAHRILLIARRPGRA